MNYRLQLLINGIKYYTFIHSDIHTVQDLINHITQKFNIDNFSLLVNDSIIVATDDIGVINPNDILIVRLDSVHPFLTRTQLRIEAPTENTIKDKKSKKRKPCNMSIDTENVEQDNAKKQKIAVFEPSATSSAKRETIGSRIQYYNNLSNANEDKQGGIHEEPSKELNIPHPDPETVSQSKHLIREHLKKSVSGTPDLITPVVSDNKGIKKKKWKLSEMDVDQRDENEVQIHEKEKSKSTNSFHGTPEAIPSTSKACQVLENVENNTDNFTKVTPNQPLHITPARDIQPITHLTKKVNLVKSITVRNGLIVSEQAEKISEKIAMETSLSGTSTLNGSTQREIEIVSEESTPANVNTNARATQMNNDVTSSTDPLGKARCKLEKTIASAECTPTTISKSPVSKSTPTVRKSVSDLSLSSFLAKLREDEVESETSNSKDTSEDRFITRRRDRKRVRKSKKQNVHVDTPFPEVKEKVYRKPNIEAKPLMHKFFNDETEEAEEMVDNIDLTNSREELEIIDVTKESKEDDKVEVINTNRVEVVNGIDMKFLEKPLTQETIDKLSVIKDDFIPTIGDVLVFQMLKMDDSYSPTWSNFILGEVKSFDKSTGSVKLYIRDGLSEFAQPQGALNNTGNEENSEELDTIQTLQWNHMIKPRLLFP